MSENFNYLKTPETNTFKRDNNSSNNKNSNEEQKLSSTLIKTDSENK